MKSIDWIPGVPSVGHLTSNGYWHPGSCRNCNKQPCIKDNCTHVRTFTDRLGRSNTTVARCRDCGEIVGVLKS